MLSTIINQQLFPHVHLQTLCQKIPLPTEKQYIWTAIFEKERGKKVKHVPFIKYVPSIDNNKVMHAYIKLSATMFKLCMFEHDFVNIESIEILEYIKLIKETLYKSIMENDYQKHIYEMANDINLYIAESHPECLIYKNLL